MLAVAVSVAAIAGAVAALAILPDSGGQPAAAPSRTDSSAPPSPPTAPPVWVASATHPTRVWMGGDSLAGELEWGLTPLLDGAGVFRSFAFYKGSSGICRYDYFHWERKIRSVMAKVRPDAVVFMVGANDTQSVWTADHWIHYGTAEWKTAYGRRVGRLMDIMLKSDARRIYWVGMPIMRQRWRDSRMRAINSIVAGQAGERAGVTFVDIRDLFADTKGAYVAKWRTSDGVHFTTAGWRRLGKRVYRYIKADWSAATTPTASPSASSSPSGSPVP